MQINYKPKSTYLSSFGAGDADSPAFFFSNIASMSFNEQVALMASTGILIAPHGAAIANSSIAGSVQ